VTGRRSARSDAARAFSSEGRLTRRAFLARTAALGVAASSLGGLLSACELAARPSPSAVPSPFPGDDGTPPVVHPTPAKATYGAMLELGAIAPVALPSSLQGLLDEVAGDAGIAVLGSGYSRHGTVRLTVTADDPSLASQAYRLEIVPAADGPAVTVRAGDEAGAYYALLSFAQLVVADGSTHLVRAASIGDTPGFSRRGAILDPYVLPDVGVTADSRALLLERIRFGVRHKLNFLDLVDRKPWPDLVRYCQAHHVELMNAVGYMDRLTVTPRVEVKRQLGELFDAGTRTFSFGWDDIGAANPEALARLHAGIFRDLYRYVRGRDAGVRVSAVLPPYGGVPGKHLVGSTNGEGERYLAVMRDLLPDDVLVFWTGDGGVFSSSVTKAGARAYADAIGHEIGLWDNDTITFSRARKPCTGRAANLSEVVGTYMGNLAGEANWTGTDGEFAMLTSLMYAWNPTAYDAAAAGVAAERILAAAAMPASATARERAPV